MNESARFLAWVVFWWLLGEALVHFTALTAVQFGWLLAGAMGVWMLVDYARKP